MVRSLYIPAVIPFIKELAETIEKVEAVNVSADVQRKLLKQVSGLLESAYYNNEKLAIEQKKAHGITDSFKRAEAFRDAVLATMNGLRKDIDTLETIVPRKLWPVPTYADLLFKL